MSTENLSQVEEKKKFREMVDKIKVTMFATNLTKKTAGCGSDVHEKSR